MENSPSKPRDPVVLAVAAFFHAVRDIEECVENHVKPAVKRHAETLDTLKADISVLRRPVNEAERGPLTRTLFDTIWRVDRWASSDPGATLRTALFLRVFSAFDTFTGDLLRALFAKKPALFCSLGGEVKASEILKASDLASLKSSLVSNFVEDLRRSSYIDQFHALESLFHVSTLVAFEHWPAFVESAQRRNLFAHCDGIVSPQYLAICRSVKAPLEPDVALGRQVPLTDAYLVRACRLVMEVALKLAQTLWRKALPEELAGADVHLHEVGYEALLLQEWDWAAMIGEFAAGLPRHSDEQSRLIALINWAIAERFGGRVEHANALLGAQDWSATLPEFKLAVAVLSNRYDEAAEHMRRIGPKGEILREASYHAWPLLRDFRGTQQFLDAYESVYGYPFVQELKPEGFREPPGLEASQEAQPAPDLSQERVTENAPDPPPSDSPAAPEADA